MYDERRLLDSSLDEYSAKEDCPNMGFNPQIRMPRGTE